MSYSCDEFTAGDYSSDICRCADCRLRERNITGGHESFEPKNIAPAPSIAQLLPANSANQVVPTIPTVPTVPIVPKCVAQFLPFDRDFENCIFIMLLILIILVVQITNSLRIICAQTAVGIISEQYNHL